MIGRLGSAASYRIAIASAVVVLLGATLVVPGLVDRGERVYEPPYLASSFIHGVHFDFAGRRRLAPGSDNWPITWADDGHQYAAWGDGGGFGGTNLKGRVSLGVARIEGAADQFTGTNVWGGVDAENRATFIGKSRGIISIGGRLFMWVTPKSNVAGYGEARMCVSEDHGATWKRADWAFQKSDNIIMPTFLQFGRDYAGARDDYVYTYAPRLMNASRLGIQMPGKIDLMRAPQDRLMDRASYEFFAGCNSQGEPRWTSDNGDRRAVFEDGNGVGWCASVSYNAGIDRYLLITEHGESFRGNMGMFEAPEPWGPWATVVYTNDWGNIGPTFFWNFSNKWLSDDGQRFVLIFTGIEENDAWGSLRGEFSLVPQQVQ